MVLNFPAKDASKRIRRVRPNLEIVGDCSRRPPAPVGPSRARLKKFGPRIDRAPPWGPNADQDWSGQSRVDEPAQCRPAVNAGHTEVLDQQLALDRLVLETNI